MSQDRPTDPLEVQRVRHELKRRRLQVLRRTVLTPNVVSLTFTGDDLADFVSASFDDHVKVLFSDEVKRDYTPRRFDTAARELDIEFSLHGDGPAARWASGARPGDVLNIGGPRGSFVVPTGYDWHLLAGDDTALPAIARRLEELPAGARAQVVLAVAEEDRRALPSAADVTLQWVEPGADALVNAVAALRRPAGDGYAWAAGEARAVARVREVLVGPWGLENRRVRCAAYWKAGAVAHHENLG
jgi:NADPH-dependent ferric siderophore reductase